MLFERAEATFATEAVSSPRELDRLVDVMTELGRYSDALGVHLGRLANALEASGRGPSADDALSGKGKKSSKAAGRKKTKRAKTADEFPPVGEGHQGGDVPTENLDALGRAADELTDKQRVELKARDEELAAKAAAQSPDQFRLIPISVRWHHRFHEGGWTAKLLPDRTLEVFRPDGTHDQTVAPPTPATRRHEFACVQMDDLLLGVTPSE